MTAEPLGTLASPELIKPPSHPGILGTIEHYHLVKVLGRGGMGVVFLARDGETGREVALKTLRPEYAHSPRVLQRFLSEARHLEALRHPHLMPVLAVRDLKQGAYFVMPYFQQGSLAERLKKGEPLPAEQALGIARQVASALQSAHAKGIIHHDLKPGNVLLKEDGTACLADFGLARTVFNDSFIDVTKEQCEGTAPYMSPAVAAGEAEDTRCDIYGVGALLYEMLTGRRPYEGATLEEVRRKILSGPPQPIRELNPKADPALTRVAEWAMAREQRERYAGMRDLAGDLDRIERGEPPLGPHGQWKAPRRWQELLRGRSLAVGGLAALGVLVAFLVWLQQPSLAVADSLVLKEVQVSGLFLADWDADKLPEIFVMGTNGACLVYSCEGKLEATLSPRTPVAGLLHLRGVQDFDRDGNPDVLLSWADNEKTHLAAYNRIKFELVRFSVKDEYFDHPQHGRVHTTLTSYCLTDLDHDGRREMLVTMLTGWSHGRGLACFDAETGSLLWEQRTAANPLGIMPVDLDGDGKDEVLLGSAAVGNRISRDDGTDDGHCYLSAISHTGALLWRVQLGDMFCRCEPLLLPQPSGRNPRLYAVVHASSEPRRKVGLGVGYLVELDASGREIARYDAGVSITSTLVDDLDEDRKPDILATDEQGVLHVLDADLRPIARKEITRNAFSSVRLSLVAITNLTGDRAKHIAVASSQGERVSGENVGNNLTDVIVEFWHNNSIQVWDRNLQKVAEHVVETKAKTGPHWTVQVADWDNDGIHEIVSVWTDTATWESECSVLKLY